MRSTSCSNEVFAGWNVEGDWVKLNGNMQTVNFSGFFKIDNIFYSVIWRICKVHMEICFYGMVELLQFRKLISNV